MIPHQEMAMNYKQKGAWCLSRAGLIIIQSDNVLRLGRGSAQRAFGPYSRGPVDDAAPAKDVATRDGSSGMLSIMHAYSTATTRGRLLCLARWADTLNATAFVFLHILFIGQNTRGSFLDKIEQSRSFRSSCGRFRINGRCSGCIYIGSPCRSSHFQSMKNLHQQSIHRPRQGSAGLQQN